MNRTAINSKNVPEISYLSTKSIPVAERLILALDVETIEQAKKLVSELGDSVVFYKVGLQLFMAGGYFELIDWLLDRGKKIFVDLKFFDVPQTVKSAVAQLKNRNVTFTTVHGNDTILRAAVEAKNNVKILAVTALTSLDKNDLNDLGFQCDVQNLVASRARRAIELGCDGIVSSGLEAPRIRESLGRHFFVVTPGIRPVDNVEDDQKRVVSVEQAFLNGADYIVIGRPIRNAEFPRAKAEETQESIASIFTVA